MVDHSCLSILVHWALVGTVEDYIEGHRGTHLIPFVNLYNILQNNTRVVKKEHDMGRVHTKWVTRARLQLW